MAKTQIDSDNALTKKGYEEKMYRDTKKMAFFPRFHGAGAEALVQVKSDRMGMAKGGGKAATQLVFPLAMRLTGAGFTSRQNMEGNEQALVTHDYTLALDFHANAIRDAGTLDRMRPAWDLDEASRSAVLVWGSEKIDELHFDAIQASPTRVISPVTVVPYTTTPLASAKLALTTAAKITPEYLSKLRVYAKTGGARTIIPIRPIKIPGFNKSLYVFLAHDDAVYDFVQDSKIQQNLRDARERSKEHPLFMGAVGYTNDGVIIYGHENMNIGTDAGSGSDVPYSQAVMMGAQALCYAEGMRPKLVSKKFNYETENGHSWQTVQAVGKPVFDSEDYGSIGSVVARTQISDAA